MHIGLSFPVLSWPGVQIALVPQGLGSHRSPMDINKFNHVSIHIHLLNLLQ